LRHILKAADIVGAVGFVVGCTGLAAQVSAYLAVTVAGGLVLVAVRLFEVRP